MLVELALSDRYGARVGIEQDGARRGRPLIDRQDMIRGPHAIEHKDARRMPEEAKGSVAACAGL